MPELRERLEEQRRRYRMPDDSGRALERRRARRRRQRRLSGAIVALAVAAAGIGIAVAALPRGTGHPGGPTSAPTPSQVPAVSLLPAVPVSGPIEFVDAAHGWMVEDGRLAATDDGGRSWRSVPLGASVAAAALDFVDPAHGWLLTEGGAMLRTADGGATWTRVVSPGRGTTSFQFRSASEGWAVAGGDVYRTADGGESWGRRAAGESVCASADGRVVWVAGPAAGGASVRRSVDAGASWYQTHVTAGGLEGGSMLRCAADGGEAFLLLTGGGAAGHIAYAAFQLRPGAAGGASAHPVLEAGFAAAEIGLPGAYQDEDPYPGVMADLGDGLAVFLNWCPACNGPSAYAVRTAGDPAAVGGRAPLPTGTGPAQPLGISFADRSEGWVLLRVQGSGGPHSLVLMTRDGGATWGRSR